MAHTVLICMVKHFELIYKNRNLLDTQCFSCGWFFLITGIVVVAVNCSILLSVGPPSRPSKPLVERSGLTLTSFKLTFIVDSAGSGPITHCIVNATSTTGEILRVFNVTVTVSPAEGSAVQVQATVTGLERNVVYRFSVSAGGPYGHGEFSVLSDPQEIGLYTSSVHHCCTCISRVSIMIFSFFTCTTLSFLYLFSDISLFSSLFCSPPLPTPSPPPYPQFPLSNQPTQPHTTENSECYKLQLDSHLFAVYQYYLVLPTFFYSSYPLHR